MCHLMQHHLLWNTLLPVKIFNSLKINSAPSQFWVVEIPTGLQLVYGLCVGECGRTGMKRLKSIHPTRSLSVGFHKV